MAIVINSLTPENPSAAAGDSVFFTVSAIDTSGGVLTYLWQFSQDGVNYTSSGLTNNTSFEYDTGNLTINQSGLYFRVAISDGTSTIYSNEYPGIGDRIVTVYQNPSIITLVNDNVDFYPDTDTLSVGETLTLTVSASLLNVDVTNSSLVSNISFQWQYSTDDGSNWINLSNGGDVSITSTIDFFDGNPDSYYKYSNLQISNITFDYNLYQFRVIVSYPGALNTPVTLSPVIVYIDPVINVYRHPGEGNDTKEFLCFKTADSSTGKIKLQVGALTTANTNLTFDWEFATDVNDFTGTPNLDILIEQYNCILKPGTTSNSDVLELERFIFYNTLYVRGIISGTSGEATVITNTHTIFPKDVQVNPTMRQLVYDAVEDRYGNIADRELYVNDPIRNVFIDNSLNVARNTGLNGDITAIYQRKDPGTTTWYDIGNTVTDVKSSNFVTYVQIPSSTPEFREIQYSTPPIRRSVDNGAKYRIKIQSTSIFNLSGQTKTLVPYYSDEITLNVYRDIYILSQPQNSTAYPNTTTSFSVLSTASSGNDSDIAYQWQYNTTSGSSGWQNVPSSSPYSGVNTNTLIINPVPTTITYRYFRCVLSLPDGLSSRTTSVAQLTIDRDLFVSISSINDAFVDEFENVTFTVEASTLSNRQITYQWQKSTNYIPSTNTGTWSDIPGKTSNTITFISVSPSDNAFYRLKLTSFGGEVRYSNAAQLNVTALSVTVTQNIPTSLTVLEGVANAYTFSCRGASSVGTEVLYQWERSLPYTPITGNNYTVTGQSYTLNGNTYPVNGILYVPDIPATSIDVVVMYHGTISSQSETIMQAAQNVMNIALSDTQLNLKDKIIFSVAYPQDAIPASNQFNIGGNEDPNFVFESNLPYAHASLLWVKNTLNSYMSSISVAKTISRVFTFGHSQGGSLVHKLNTLEQVSGAIMNAPGPIKLDLTCAAEETTGNLSTTCQKLFNLYGSASGSNRQEYINRSVISYDSGLLSEMLYIQGQQDTVGNGNQTTWLEDLLDLLSANSTTNADYTYLPVPGTHYAVSTSVEAQEAVRNFVFSSASSPQFTNAGSGFGGSSDTTNSYAPLQFDRITQNLSRIRCKLTASGVPNPSYTNQCIITVNRRFSYFADTAVKNVTNGSSLTINLNPFWTGGLPEYSWEVSTNGGSSWTVMGETDSILFIPTVDSSFTGRIYRCRVTLTGCNQHQYTRNNVTQTVSVNEVAYTLPISVNIIPVQSKPKYYSLETQKTGASIGTVICIPKPADFVYNSSENNDDFLRWKISRTGSLSTTGNTSSVTTSGSTFNANKPSWASSSYKSPRWLLREDRFAGYVEMRGQYLKAVEFPELARMFGNTYGGNIASQYPLYQETEIFRMPNLYGKRLLGTGNVNNNSGSVSITPTHGPDGLSGGDKNVPGTMGGLYNYTRSAQLPPGSPGVVGVPDGTAGVETPATFALGSFRSTGVDEVNAFVQPTFSGTVTYAVGRTLATSVDTPTHNHTAVSAAYRDVTKAGTSECRSKAQVLVSNLFRGVSSQAGEIGDLSDIVNTGADHSHGCESGCGDTIDMVRDGGMNISDTTARLSGASRQIFDNNLEFFLRNNSDIPLNSPYYRLKYMIKAY